MMLKRGLIIGAALLGLGTLMFILASPAQAGDKWKLESVECQADNQTIIVTGEVRGTGQTVDDVYYNGRLVYNQVFSLDDAGPGRFSYLMKRSFIRLGGEVRITNGGDSVTTICVNSVPLNQTHGENWAKVFRDVDATGDPSLKVYCIIDGQGQYRGEVTRAEFKAYPSHPETNILVKQIEGCVVPIAFYQLTSGERQLNIGPDFEGKTSVTVFRKMPPVDVHYYDIDPYYLPNWY